eukprot:2080428-Rhodomonas_salina.2
MQLAAAGPESEEEGNLGERARVARCRSHFVKRIVLRYLFYFSLHCTDSKAAAWGADSRKISSLEQSEAVLRHYTPELGCIDPKYEASPPVKLDTCVESFKTKTGAQFCSDPYLGGEHDISNAARQQQKLYNSAGDLCLCSCGVGEGIGHACDAATVLNTNSLDQSLTFCPQSPAQATASKPATRPRCSVLRREFRSLRLLNSHSSKALLSPLSSLSSLSSFSFSSFSSLSSLFSYSFPASHLSPHSTAQCAVTPTRSLSSSACPLTLLTLLTLLTILARAGRHLSACSPSTPNVTQNMTASFHSRRASCIFGSGEKLTCCLRSVTALALSNGQ